MHPSSGRTSAVFPSAAVRILGIALAAIGLLSAAGCGVGQVATVEDGLGNTIPAFRTGMQERRFQLDGLNRSYLLYIPVSAGDGEMRPLVLVLHGGGGTARGLPRLTNRRWNALAEQFGFYLVYPNAHDRFWDFGEGRISERLEQRVDDGAYFRTLLDELQSGLAIDRDRVFATGISRGGQASYFLACRFPGQFRAIAPVVMPLPDYLEDDCRREDPPVGLALFNGTEDPLVPYDGGWITFGNDRRDMVLSTDDTVALWRARNGCRPAADRTRIIDTADDGMQVIRNDWTSCSGAPVTLYRIEGGGHTYPSGRRSLLELVVGPVNQDINAADETWAFFSQFE